MPDSQADLASLLCSRLCHDMLSPVGAMSNGLELLIEEQDEEMRARCMELLQQSAKISTDKLKFYRLAFGAAGGFGDEVPVTEAHGVIAALVSNNERISLDWQVASESLPKPAIKVLLNLALFAYDALIRGGTLQIAAERSSETSEIVVRATGTKIAFNEEIGRAMEGATLAEGLSPKTAPAAMIHALASEMGGTLQYAITEDALVLGAVIPVG